MATPKPKKNKTQKSKLQLSKKLIAELKADPDNPRDIEFDAMVGLGHSIDTFGDLSGIVYNTKLNKLVAGHRRVESLIGLYGDKLEIVDGYITTPKGEKFRIRYVDFDDNTHAMARETANNPHIAGFFTDKLQSHLQAMQGKSPEMYESLRLDRMVVIPKAEKKVPRKSSDDDSMNERQDFEYKVLIDCTDEEQQTAIIEQLQELGIESSPLVL